MLRRLHLRVAEELADSDVAGALTMSASDWHPASGRARLQQGKVAAMPWIAALRGLRQAGSVEPVTVQPGRSSPRQIGDLCLKRFCRSSKP